MLTRKIGVHMRVADIMQQSISILTLVLRPQLKTLAMFVGTANGILTPYFVQGVVLETSSAVRTSALKKSW